MAEVLKKINVKVKVPGALQLVSFCFQFSPFMLLVKAGKPFTWSYVSIVVTKILQIFVRRLAYKVVSFLYIFTRRILARIKYDIKMDTVMLFVPKKTFYGYIARKLKYDIKMDTAVLFVPKKTSYGYIVQTARRHAILTYVCFKNTAGLKIYARCLLNTNLDKRKLHD